MNPNLIIANNLRQIAAKLLQDAARYEMGESWSINPDNVKPDLKVVK